MRRSTVLAAVLAAVAALLTVAAPAGATTTVLLPAGSPVRFLDTGTDLGTAWRAPGYADTSWRSGRTQLGYGDGDEATAMAPGRLTYYARSTFSVTDLAGITGLTVRVLLDDGAALYLNGTEILRDNLPAGATAATPATVAVAGAGETTWRSFTVPRTALVAGTNVLAVELHNSAATSSDISWDVEVAATTSTTAVAPPETTRVLCRIDNPLLREISGMAASVRFPGIVWVHNDSGDTARVFALDVQTCAVRATVTLSGVTARDFEAISMGRDAAGGPELWVGDTGDNGRSRPNIALYRFPEPQTLSSQSVTPTRVTVTWTDGARDCESLLVEPVPNGRVYLISKEVSSGLYALQGDFRRTGTAVTGTRISSFRAYATDAAVAPDRSRTVLRLGNYGTWWSGFPGTAPRNFMYPTQPQGEAVSFSSDSRSLYIASEGVADLIRIPVSSLPQ